MHTLVIKLEGPHLMDLPQVRFGGGWAYIMEHLAMDACLREWPFIHLPLFSRMQDFPVQLRDFLSQQLHMGPLHLALSQGCIQVVLLLLELGRGAGQGLQWLHRQLFGERDVRQLLAFVRNRLPEYAWPVRVTVVHKQHALQPPEDRRQPLPEQGPRAAYALGDTRAGPHGTALPRGEPPLLEPSTSEPPLLEPSTSEPTALPKPLADRLGADVARVLSSGPAPGRSSHDVATRTWGSSSIATAASALRSGGLQAGAAWQLLEKAVRLLAGADSPHAAHGGGADATAARPAAAAEPQPQSLAVPPASAPKEGATGEGPAAPSRPASLPAAAGGLADGSLSHGRPMALAQQPSHGSVTGGRERATAHGLEMPQSAAQQARGFQELRKQSVKARLERCGGRPGRRAGQGSAVQQLEALEHRQQEPGVTGASVSA